MSSRILLLGLACVCGCPSPSPRVDGPHWNLQPAAKAKTTADGAPLARLRRLVLEEKDAVMEKMLLDLLAAETDQRCRAYLEAGRRAWLGARPHLARALWRAALACGPRSPYELDAGDRVVRVVRPVRLALGKHPRLSDFPAPGSEPADRDRRFLTTLCQQMGFGSAVEVLEVRRGWALVLVRKRDARRFELAWAQMRRRHAGKLVRARMHFVSVRAEHLPPLLEPFFALKGVKLLSKEGARLVLGLAKRAGRATTLAAPQVTVFPFQRAHVAVVSQTAYIRDYEIVPSSGGWMADPVVGLAREGVTVEIEAVLLAKGAVHAQVAPRLAVVHRPIPEIRLDLSHLGLRAVRMQVPATTSLEGVFELRQRPGDSHWIPLGVTSGPSGRRRLVALLVTLQAIG